MTTQEALDLYPEVAYWWSSLVPRPLPRLRALAHSPEWLARAHGGAPAKHDPHLAAVLISAEVVAVLAAAYYDSTRLPGKGV